MQMFCTLELSHRSPAPHKIGAITREECDNSKRPKKSDKKAYGLCHKLSFKKIDKRKK